MLRKTFLLLIVLFTVNAIAFAQPDSLVSNDFSGPATWGNNRTWIINNANDVVHLTSGTLTIQAGTTVKFAEDNSLIVDSIATLTAIGNSENWITFTSNEETPSAGAWGMVRIGNTAANDDTATGTFSHCLFEYGGGATTDPVAQDDWGMLHAGGYADISVDTCVFHSSATAAIEIGHQPHHNTFDVRDCEIYNCQSGILSADQAPDLGDENNLEKLGTDGSFCPCNILY